MKKLSLLVLIVFSNIIVISAQIIFDNTGRSYTKFMGLELEKSTIADCIAKYGDTKLIKAGDGACSSTRLNYYIKNENTYITFDSGEMGSDKYITSVILSNKKPAEAYKVIDKYQFSKTDFGKIRIGMKREEIINSFKSLIWNNEVGEVWYLNKIPMPLKVKNALKVDEKYALYDENIVLRFYFLNGILSKYSVIKVTSY